MLEAGRVLGRRYEIISEIGSGGMANVYKARDQKLDRLVAIKVLKQEFTMDNTILEKFRKEALAAGGLNHPNIVSVYDMGHELGSEYIVMELIDGITLKEYIRKRGHLTSEEIIKISIRVAEALKAAHENGIIHRDIKPQNIMVTPSGEVKVTDFGIAKGVSSTTVTASGETLGSVHYLSPEQARGSKVDARSDLYSLGITMYEMATSQLPFTADTPVAVAMKQLNEMLPNPMAKAPDLWPCPLSVGCRSDRGHETPLSESCSASSQGNRFRSPAACEKRSVSVFPYQAGGPFGYPEYPDAGSDGRRKKKGRECPQTGIGTAAPQKTQAVGDHHCDFKCYCRHRPGRTVMAADPERKSTDESRFIADGHRKFDRKQGRIEVRQFCF